MRPDFEGYVGFQVISETVLHSSPFLSLPLLLTGIFCLWGEGRWL